MNRKEEMLKLRLEGKTHAEIGKVFDVSRQRVQKIIGSIPVSRVYIVDGDETPQNEKQGVVKGVLDKIALVVKKFV